MLSLLKRKKLVIFGDARTHDLEIDFSKPFGDYCRKCKLKFSKLYFAKDRDDVVICPICHTAYHIVPIILTIPESDSKEKDKERELLKY